MATQVQTSRTIIRGVIFVMFKKIFLILLSGLLLVACKQGDERLSGLTLEQKIAQKIAIDLRYFCLQEGVDDEPCRTPVTELPPALSRIISDSQVGGVILFAENFSTPSATLALVDDLQQASLVTSRFPLLVATDQEGGKVARLPREWAPAFTGNMSIAATGEKADYYAEQVGKAIGEQLAALGVFVNYAPTVDVNANPANPVINTRSFSESSARVAHLGGLMTQAMQGTGIAATLKHFPGHGDTHVDSHTGLPLVDHVREQVMAQDVLPFAQIIKSAKPKLIMTAHIQYPALDATTLTTVSGEQAIVPATLSRKIMTDLLRGELGYEGVTTTDALDMAGVAAMWPDPVERTVKTFAAGVDIALMPFKIRTPADGEKLQKLIADVADMVRSGDIQFLTEKEIDASLLRIVALKESLPIRAWLALSRQQRTVSAEQVLSQTSQRELESALALAAVTHVYGSTESLPIMCAKPNRLAAAAEAGEVRRLVVVAPTVDIQQALTQRLVTQMTTLSVQSFILKDYADPERRNAMLNAHCLLLASVTPAGSPVDMGGMDDVLDRMKTQAGSKSDAWADVSAREASRVQQLQFSLLRAVNQRAIPTLFLSMRAPYDIRSVASVSTAAYASYDFNSVSDGVAVRGPAFDAVVEVLSGRSLAQGQLPVTVFESSMPGTTIDLHD